MALLQDLDHLPTLEQEGLDQSELAVIQDWVNADQRLAERVRLEGPEALWRPARFRVALRDNLEIALRARNPLLHPLQIREMVERDLSSLPVPILDEAQETLSSRRNVFSG